VGKGAVAPCPPAALLVGTLRLAHPTIADMIRISETLI
jgi:hypothetical protein